MGVQYKQREFFELYEQLTFQDRIQIRIAMIQMIAGRALRRAAASAILILVVAPVIMIGMAGIRLIAAILEPLKSTPQEAARVSDEDLPAFR